MADLNSNILKRPKSLFHSFQQSASPPVMEKTLSMKDVLEDLEAMEMNPVVSLLPSALKRPQSMRVPPGFEAGHSRGFNSFESDYTASPQGVLGSSSRVAAPSPGSRVNKSMKRVVTFSGNLRASNSKTLGNTAQYLSEHHSIDSDDEIDDNLAFGADLHELGLDKKESPRSPLQRLSSSRSILSATSTGTRSSRNNVQKPSLNGSPHQAPKSNYGYVGSTQAMGSLGGSGYNNQHQVYQPPNGSRSMSPIGMMPPQLGSSNGFNPMSYSPPSAGSIGGSPMGQYTPGGVPGMHTRGFDFSNASVSLEELERQKQQINMMQQSLHNQMMMNYMMQQQQQQARPVPFGRSSPPVMSTENGNPVSALLISHKTAGYRPSLQEILGHVVEFSRDSHGSRLVQCLMENASKEEKEALIDEVLPQGVSLMQDLFGNYVMQNFLEHANSAQRKVLSRQVRENMHVLSMQPHGCRVVQKAIDILPSGVRNNILKEILFPEELIIKGSKDPHATHVLQKAVSWLQKEIKFESPKELLEENILLLKAIEEAVTKEILTLAVHPHACRLVQRVLGDCDYSRSPNVAKGMEEVRRSFDVLSADQHGNFILQHIIDHGNSEQTEEVQNYVRKHFLDLAQHKFGSHLVEKCLQRANESDSNELVRQLIELSSVRNPSGSDNEDMLMSLMKDPYANFVVQRAFDVSRGERRQELVQVIQSRSEILSRFTYGRHILSHVNKSRAF